MYTYAGTIINDGKGKQLDYSYVDFDTSDTITPCMSET